MMATFHQFVCQSDSAMHQSVSSAVAVRTGLLSNHKELVVDYVMMTIALREPKCEKTSFANLFLDDIYSVHVILLSYF